MLAPKIIFEDDHILIIDKPSGLVVNRAETVKRGESLQDWLDKKLSPPIGGPELRIDDNKTILNEFKQRSGLVHRLDKDTSGVMIIAKTIEAYKNLLQQFKNRQVHKEYLALVHGRIEPGKGNIRMPIARNPKDRKKFSVQIGGRAAFTSYQRIKLIRLPNKEVVSLLKVFPQTGRTHQIRVHLSFLGYPICADPIYLNHKRLMQDHCWCWRLFLHAYNINFLHPQTQHLVSFKAELPRGLTRLI